MGGHYGTIHFRNGDAVAIAFVVGEVARERKLRFLIAPPIDSWITVFPEENGQDEEVSHDLARRLPDHELIHCLVHDDDIFAYWYFKAGVLVDRYNSCPDYFDDENPEPRGGNAQAFVHFLQGKTTVANLQTLLDSERFDFEMERLERFARILNLPNAVTAYEYLQDGERDGIEGWKQFFHIPDRTAERAAKRAAKAKAAAEMKQLSKSGLLILDVAGQKETRLAYPSTPVWSINPSTSEVLLAWSRIYFGPVPSTRVFRVDHLTGETAPTKVEVSGSVLRIAASSTHPWIAAGFAIGDRKTEVWDLTDGKLVVEIPQSGVVGSVCFGQDGKTLYCLSERTITVVNLMGVSPRRTIVLPGAAQSMALHPGGEYLVAQYEGILALVHLPTLTTVKSLWIPQPPGPERDLMEYAASTGMVPHFLPKQSVFSLSFGSQGNYLFCGTTAGVCIFGWEKVLAAADMNPIDPMAFIPAEGLVRDEGMPVQQLIYAVPVDSAARRVLFVGLEGKIRFGNFKDGRIGDLLNPPIKRPFWNLELTPDRASLVGAARPMFEDKERKRDPVCFQIWNYKALCAAANLDW